MRESRLRAVKVAAKALIQSPTSNRSTTRFCPVAGASKLALRVSVLFATEARLRPCICPAKAGTAPRLPAQSTEARVWPLSLLSVTCAPAMYCRAFVREFDADGIALPARIVLRLVADAGADGLRAVDGNGRIHRHWRGGRRRQRRRRAQRRCRRQDVQSAWRSSDLQRAQDAEVPRAWVNHGINCRAVRGRHSMLTLHQMQMSGNCYKVRLAARQLGIAIALKEYPLMAGETRKPEFLAAIRTGACLCWNWTTGAPRGIECDPLVSEGGLASSAHGQTGPRAGAAMDVLRTVQPRALCGGQAHSGLAPEEVREARLRKSPTEDEAAMPRSP